MQDNNKPTSYPDINIVLDYFLRHIKEILEDHFVGMYLYGSLAMGDFDKNTSDIDFIVITDTDVSESEFIQLHALHKRFYSSDSPWSKKVEVAYIAKRELGHYEKTMTLYPQIEKGRELIKDKLEMGWAFQCYTLREHGIVIEGPDPHTLFDPVSENYIFQAVKSIANVWKEQAHDEREMGWLIQREEQAFVILTLCRFLHFLSEGKITSKKSATQWALTNLEKKWHELIKQAISKNNQPLVVDQYSVKKTIEFIDYAALMLRLD